MKLYHYRSIENALLELENGTFHFASREELNDPLEGYIRVCWQGDKAAWEGLLKNYICSVDQAITLYLLAADFDMLHRKTLVLSVHQNDNVPLGKIWRKLEEDFLSDPEVQNIIAFYGGKKLKVYKDELMFVLRYLHTKAITLCLKSNIKHGTIERNEGEKMLEGFQHKEIEFPTNLLESNSPDDRERMILTKIMENYMQDILEYFYVSRWDDVALYDGKSDEELMDEDSEKAEARQFRNWLSVVVDFPDTYVEQLMELIYPAAYITCFSGKNDDSVMWGNYADNHKGVCLIYETDDEDKIRVNKKTGCHAGDKREFFADYSWNEIPVRKVEYGGEICERNFFETFGRLTRMEIESWLAGTEGISSCYDVFKDEDKWRNQYWEAFKLKNCHKMKEWSYEEEYRLIVDNTFGEFEKPEDRNLKYDPKALKGVIFGTRTCEYDKQRIVNALKRSNKTDVLFYQAEYDEELRRIRVREKAMWNRDNI